MSQSWNFKYLIYIIYIIYIYIIQSVSSSLSDSLPSGFSNLQRIEATDGVHGWPLAETPCKCRCHTDCARLKSCNDHKLYLVTLMLSCFCTSEHTPTRSFIFQVLHSGPAFPASPSRYRWKSLGRKCREICGKWKWCAHLWTVYDLLFGMSEKEHLAIISMMAVGERRKNGTSCINTQINFEVNILCLPLTVIME